MLPVYFLLLIFSLSACSDISQKNNLPVISSEKTDSVLQKPVKILNPAGKILLERFREPDGFVRMDLDSLSFGFYLRHLPLKPDGAEVHLFDGSIKYSKVWEAVVDMDVGNRDLQQCADAVMRLWAEYLWEINQKDKIHFNFTNGFRVDYAKWRQGYRIHVSGNKTNWYKATSPDDSYKSFRKYMNIIFNYAGSLSLSKELKPVKLEEIMSGDVFIHGGSPGHAVIVLDVAKNAQTGETMFMVAQSYMPAQEIQVLKNLNNPEISPWYNLNAIGDEFYSPEWTFSKDELMRFGE